MGFAVTTVRYNPASILNPIAPRIDADEAMDDVRDRFLADYHAELSGERPVTARGFPGREFEAKLMESKDPQPMTRHHPPGPGVGHVKARLFALADRVYLVYVTTPEGRGSKKGVETFLDSFMPLPD